MTTNHHRLTADKNQRRRTHYKSPSCQLLCTHTTKRSSPPCAKRAARAKCTRPAKRSTKSSKCNCLYRISCKTCKIHFCKNSANLKSAVPRVKSQHHRKEMRIRPPWTWRKATPQLRLLDWQRAGSRRQRSLTSCGTRTPTFSICRSRARRFRAMLRRHRMPIDRSFKTCSRMRWIIISWRLDWVIEATSTK